MRLAADPKPGHKKARRSNQHSVALLNTTKQSVSKKKEDMLDHYTKWDFIDNEEKKNRSPEVAYENWRLARKGKLPPWTPSISRGVRCVAKLAPERVRCTKGWTETQDVKKRKADPNRPLGKGLAKRLRKDVDGVELMPSSQAVTMDPGEVGSSDEEDLAAPKGKGEAQVQAASKPRRHLPGSFAQAGAVQAPSDGTSLTGTPRSGRRIAAVHVAGHLKLNSSPGAGGASPGPAPTPSRGAPKELPVAFTLSEAREFLEGLPDVLDDPVDFSDCISRWNFVVDELLKTMKDSAVACPIGVALR